MYLSNKLYCLYTKKKCTKPNSESNLRNTGAETYELNAVD